MWIHTQGYPQRIANGQYHASDPELVFKKMEKIAPVIQMQVLGKKKKKRLWQEMTVKHETLLSITAVKVKNAHMRI